MWERGDYIYIYLYRIIDFPGNEALRPYESSKALILQIPENKCEFLTFFSDISLWRYFPMTMFNHSL